MPRKKLDLNKKPVKYLIARRTGKTKKEAALTAGYSDGQHVAQIENSKTYLEATRFFKDELLAQSSIEELTGALLDNIRQDTDRGARNKAIEMAMNRIEPENVTTTTEEKVLVVLG